MKPPSSPALTTIIWYRFVLSLAMALLTCHPAFAQISNSQKKDIDGLVRSFIAEYHAPGLSLAVLVNGQVVMTEGYGLADVENTVPVRANTIFRIASMSKPITAVAAMKLVESGKLDLNAPIQKYCPAFPQKQWTVTTRQLLSHQSGIRNYRNDEETVSTRHYKSINEALTQFDKDPLEFQPGSKMEYTTYGYVVLGCVIEGASGESYDTYMHQAVFGPAHMSATRLDDVFAIIPDRAHGYSVGPQGQLQNSIFVDVSNKSPAGGIDSNVRDLGNFVAALYSGQLISSTSFHQMLVPANTSDSKPTIYGFGIFVGGPIGSYRGLAEAGHGGDQQGFSSVLYLLPDKKFAVVALTNIEGQNNSVNLVGLSRKIYDVCADK